MLFSNDHRRARMVFALTDILLAVLAFEAAYQTRARLRVLPLAFYILGAQRSLALIAFVLLWTGAGYAVDVYGKFDLHRPRTIVLRTLRQAAYGAVALVIFEYSFRLEISRLFLALFALYACIFLLIFRLRAHALVGLIYPEFGTARHVLIAGLGEPAVRLAEQIEAASEQEIRLGGFLALRDTALCSMHTKANVYEVAPRGQLRSLLRVRVIDEILFAVGPEDLTGLDDLFRICDEEGVRTRVALDFFGYVESQMRLERLGAVPFLTFTSTPDDEMHLLLKRALDITLATAGLVLTSPVMLLTALAIKLTSPGPVIFRQDRCGLNGRHFTFYKFRSMIKDAEQRRTEVIHLSHRSTATKIPGDPRLTPIGAFMRRYSIDELPQLFNILKGDMSLVGPRPAIPAEVAQYQQWQRRRMRMRPGLTCTWALNGRDSVDFETWMKMDLQYIDNWSLRLDCSIILQTIPKVLLGQGAN